MSDMSLNASRSFTERLTRVVLELRALRDYRHPALSGRTEGYLGVEEVEHALARVLLSEQLAATQAVA